MPDRAGPRDPAPSPVGPVGSRALPGSPLPVLTARSAPVRDARQLTRGRVRRIRGELLAEGPQAVQAALAAGVVAALFVEEAAQAGRGAEAAVARDAGIPVHVVDRRGFADLVTAQTPQGVVAVCRWQRDSLEALLAEPAAPTGQLVVAHEIADPGNAGALIRVADAAGARAVALSERSVDPTNPKCVRATAGSLFHVPVLQAGSTPRAVAALQRCGYRVLAADVTRDSVGLFAAERDGLLAGPVAWVFGSEAHGLPPEVLGLVDHVVRIPILGRAESLNLATAAAVCLYSVARLRSVD